jgi:hypothetical protein
MANLNGWFTDHEIVDSNRGAIRNGAFGIMGLTGEHGTGIQHPFTTLIFPPVRHLIEHGQGRPKIRERSGQERSSHQAGNSFGPWS